MQLDDFPTIARGQFIDVDYPTRNALLGLLHPPQSASNKEERHRVILGQIAGKLDRLEVSLQ